MKSLEALTLNAWLAKIAQQHPQAIDLGLERVAQVAERMGFVSVPGGLSLGTVSIVVGGTNGKGSVCALLASALRASGMRVGRFVSPFLRFPRDAVTVGSDRKYAAIHQLGGKTKAHVIRPKNGKALKIPGIGFRKSVNHPGSQIPARPYFPFYADGRPTPIAHTAILQVLEKRLNP